jgi:hypothetical protein
MGSTKEIVLRELTMSKKRRPDSRIERQPDARTEEVAVIAKPRVTTFVPSPCPMCTALREEGSNYSRVVSTQGNIRYCKCSFCNNTWKEQG